MVSPENRTPKKFTIDNFRHPVLKILAKILSPSHGHLELVGYSERI